MTDGTFKTWEMLAVGLGGAMSFISLLIVDLGGEPDFKWILISLMTVFFAKPVWLLGNWKEIRTWERTTAFIRQSYTTGWGRGKRYNIYIEFFSKDGNLHHKTLKGFYSEYFKVGDKKDIMFAKEYMDALIFVPQAFRQAVVHTDIGRAARELCGVVSDSALTIIGGV